MEIWLKNSKRESPVRCNGALAALDGLTKSGDSVAIIGANSPDIDLAQLETIFRLAKRFHVDGRRIIVASDYPSVDWIKPLASLGLDRLSLWRNPRGPAPSASSAAGADKVLTRLCPHLHASTKRGKTLRLCGAGNDRIVLAQKPMEKWCLSKAKGCPHLARMETAR